jgi:hypothetical protein
MRCRGVQGIANAAYLEGFPFPALLRVAPYCAPGGVNRGIAALRSCSLMYAPEVRPAPREAPLDPAYLGPLLSLYNHFGPQHCRRDGRGLGVATPLTGECKGTQETSVVRP